MRKNLVFKTQQNYMNKSKTKKITNKQHPIFAFEYNI